MFYAIHAYSKTRNQTQRQFNQDELEGRPITNKRLAEQHADAYAQQLNSNQFLRATDWVGQIELINNTNVYKK
jgi:alkylation response protein AidB-like acyl-CoA dehydrogenase